MRTREAWLTAITAALGITEACHRDAQSHASEAGEAPSVTVASSAPVASVSAIPSASVVVPEPVPSAMASASASTSATATSPRAGSLASLAGSTTYGIHPGPGLGIEHSNPICGAPAYRPEQQVRAEVTTSLTGGIGNDQAIIAGARPRFRMCATRALQQDPNEEGRLRLSIAVAADGTVTTVTVVGNSGLSASTSQCMTNMARRLQFASSAARTLDLAITQVRQQ